MAASASEQLRLQVYEKLGQVTLTLASPVRLRIIQVLSQAPHTVEELSRACGQSVANTSQHLQKLSGAELVSVRREGLQRIYSLRNPSIALLWERLQDVAGELFPELAEMEDQITDRSLHSSKSAAEVLAEVKLKKAVLLDVRVPSDAAATPVTGAVAIPLKELPREQGHLPKSKTIYVFCRGRYCELATTAVRNLRAKGFQAFRLREGAILLSQLQEAS